MEVLLVADEGQARERYLRFLDDFGAKCRVASDPGEVLDNLRQGTFSGIVFDEPTLLREGRYDMALLRDLSERYPAIHVMFDPDTDVLHVLGSRHYPSSQEGLVAFLRECRDFSPLRMRLGQRMDVFLPVLLFRRSDGGRMDPEPAMTLNLSRHGCFVYTVSAWENGEEAWLAFEDVDPQPVRTRVAWRQAWGARRLPGVGLRFLETNQALAQELARLEAE